MKINYDLVMKTPDGEEYKDEKQKPLTLRAAIITAASLPLPGDDQLSMVEKYHAGEIGALAHKSLDLTAEQITLIKGRISKGFQSPLLVYLVHEALEGGSEK